MGTIGVFFLGVITTLIVGFGFVGAFFSVLGDDQNKLFLALIVMVIGIALPFIFL